MSSQQGINTSSSSSGLLLVSASALGVAVGAAGYAIATRRLPNKAAMDRAVSAALQDSVRDLRSGIREDIVREVNQSITKTTTHFSTSLQSQEREIGKNLQPVSLVQPELQRVNQRLEEVASIFMSTKGRGTFGEAQLENIIQEAPHFLPGSYDFQHTLSNSKRVDCLLYLPSPIGKLAVDSKFPLDAFRQQNHANGDSSLINGAARAQQMKRQKESLRKHTKDIASKYIIPGETADFAIMFLPSESLYLQVVEDHRDVLLEANNKKIWVACPTTFMVVLETLKGVTRGMTLQEDTEIALGHVQKMTQNVDLLLRRYEKAVKTVGDAQEALRLMNVSIEKIRRSKDSLDAMNLSLGPTAKIGAKRQAKKTNAEKIPSNAIDESESSNTVLFDLSDTSTKQEMKT